MSTTPAHAAYLRHPDVRGDIVTFTAANDVWLAPLEGGRAWRLTDEGARSELLDAEAYPPEAYEALCRPIQEDTADAVVVMVAVGGWRWIFWLICSLSISVL